MPDIDPLYRDLSFNSPLSYARAAALVASAGPLTGAQVIEPGCGWAELLLRFAAADPTAYVSGIDTDADAIAHGRAAATDRGLADRVSLAVGDAAGWQPPTADIAICVGASHTFGGTESALHRLRDSVRPGGRVVFGEGIWERPPTAAATSALGGDPAEFGTLADLVDLAVGAGLRPLDIGQAGAGEWDEFESGYARGWERWLLAHPDDPEAAAVRERADAHRAGWLRGYRGVLGFAYLVLVR